MLKRFSITAIILTSLPWCAVSCLADAQSPDAVPDRPMVNLTDQQVDQIIRDGEAELKKIKVVHEHLERTQHVAATQDSYQQGVTLYKQKRLSLAKDKLNKVADAMADFKSTDIVLKTIDQQTLEKLRRRVHRAKMLENPYHLIALDDEAKNLEEQSKYLMGEPSTAEVRLQLINLRRIIDRLKHERMSITPRMAREIHLQVELDQIEDKAETFDREIYKLTQANDYAAAKVKFEEFQDSMADDLEKVREEMDQH